MAIALTFVKIDSWDDEAATIKVDDTVVWTHRFATLQCNSKSGVTTCPGRDQVCFPLKNPIENPIEISQYHPDLLLKKVWFYKIQQEECGQGHDNWHEEGFRVGPVVVAHSAGSLTLRIETGLDQGAEDEAWGVQNVSGAFLLKSPLISY